VFVDVTAAYDTVSHRGLTSKLLGLLTDRHMLHMIMEMLVIAASPLTPEMAHGAGYDALRTAFHRDLSWRPFSSTSVSLTCQPPSPERMHMLTI